jgi:hypothetical protein
LGSRRASFRNHFLKIVRDLRAMIRALHPLLTDVGLLLLGVFGLIDLVRYMIER